VFCKGQVFTGATAHTRGRRGRRRVRGGARGAAAARGGRHGAAHSRAVPGAPRPPLPRRARPAAAALRPAGAAPARPPDLSPAKLGDQAVRQSWRGIERDKRVLSRVVSCVWWRHGKGEQPARCRVRAARRRARRCSSAACLCTCRGRPTSLRCCSRWWPSCWRSRAACAARTTPTRCRTTRCRARPRAARGARAHQEAFHTS